MGHICRLARVQRQALLVMTGALRTTATDTMEAHADLLPFDLLVDRLCHRSAVRLSSLPNSDPLSPHVPKAAQRFVKRHRSSLHELTVAYKTHLDTSRAEQARQLAQQRLSEAGDERERERLNGDLMRAITRLHIVETTRRRGTRRIQSQMPPSEL